MQLLLHPDYKDLNDNVCLIARICLTEDNWKEPQISNRVEKLKKKIESKLKDLMRMLMDQEEPQPEPAPVSSEFVVPQRVERNLKMFGRTNRAPRDERVVHIDRIDEEFNRWMEDASTLEPNGTDLESITKFWQRHQQEYKYLAKAARVLFAIPTSSAQIERDFGVAGNMLTRQRCSLSDQTGFC